MRMWKINKINILNAIQIWHTEHQTQCIEFYIEIYFTIHEYVCDKEVSIPIPLCLGIVLPVVRTSPFLRCGQWSVWPWKARPKFRKQNRQNVSSRTPKFKQVISMSGGIKLPRCVVIGRVVLILSFRQAIFRWSVPQSWPLFRVTERSSTTFLRPTHTHCHKYLRLSSNGVDVRSKMSRCGRGRGRKELKT